MTYEKPMVTTTVAPLDPLTPQLAAPGIFLLVAVLAADAGTWIWATRRITRSTERISGPVRPALRVVVLPGRAFPDPLPAG